MTCRRFDALKRWFAETDHPVWLLIRMFFGTFVLAAILGVLIWAFILALDLSAEGKAVALAAIGTGVALLSVAVLTLRLELLRFRRSQEPISLRPKSEFPWFWGWDQQTIDFPGGDEFDGNRWNDLHYTNAAKQAARESINGGGT